MKKLLFAAMILIAISCAEAGKPEPQLLLRLMDYPGIAHSHNVQGCAVYGDLLFSMQDKGWCNVIDLESKDLVAQFPLGSYGQQNHANVSFSMFAVAAPASIRISSLSICAILSRSARMLTASTNGPGALTSVSSIPWNLMFMREYPSGR